MNARQDSGRIEKAYDSVAVEYARQFIDEHQKKPKDGEILYSFSEKLRGRKPVWDLGCGPGQTTKYLKDLGVEISGLDLSEKMLEQAREINPDIQFRRGNILELDFEENSMAGAVAFYAIVHFTEEQVETAFCEIYRVLQPGGILLLTFHIGDETMHVDEFLGRKTDIDFMFFTVDFISGCLKKCGFADVDTIEREPYPDVEYQSRRAYVFAVKPVVR
jgi:ubiquinone/menaquinone biosynthesis C-methylase UbiE